MNGCDISLKGLQYLAMAGTLVKKISWVSESLAMSLAAKYFVFSLVLGGIFRTLRNISSFCCVVNHHPQQWLMMEVELLITLTTGGMSKQRSRREWHSTHNFSAAPMPIVSIWIQSSFPICCPTFWRLLWSTDWKLPLLTLNGSGIMMGASWSSSTPTPNILGPF